MSNYQIPYDADGNQLDYNDRYRDITWRDNEVFNDMLEYVRYERGRSSIAFIMKRTNGTYVSMFISDFSAALPHMVAGKLKGTFTFVKKGSSYGCKLIID